MSIRGSRTLASSRMLKKTSSFVLASLRGSTYGNEYASPLRSLRPCWTAFLNILVENGDILNFLTAEMFLSA